MNTKWKHPETPLSQPNPGCGSFYLGAGVCKIAPGWETLLWFLGVVLFNFAHLTLRRCPFPFSQDEEGIVWKFLQKVAFPARKLLNNFLLPLYQLSLWEVESGAGSVWHWFCGGVWHSWPWFSLVLSLSQLFAKPKAKGKSQPTFY